MAPYYDQAVEVGEVTKNPKKVSGMAVKYNPWPGYYLFMARIGRSLNASYVTTSLPAIYTDKPLETMQRFISLSVFSYLCHHCQIQQHCLLSSTLSIYML